MARENILRLLGDLTASADLHTDQYCAVKMSGVNTVTVVAAATDVAIGILQNKPVANEAAAIAVEGVSKARAGAAITAGAALMCDSSGRVITATGSTAHTLGQALETSTAADQIISVLLRSATQHIIP